MPASRNPVIFVHGYSDSGKSWGPWREVLRQRLGIDDAFDFENGCVGHRIHGFLSPLSCLR